MEIRRVGRSDLSTSLVGLGCVDFGARTDKDAAGELVAAALDRGITLFDTSDNYNGGRSEEVLGAALRGRRGRAIVSSKFTGGRRPLTADGSREHVLRSCEQSLRRLGTDCIDLYSIHHPDPDTPIDETLTALDDLVRQGKVRYLGSSNFQGWRIGEAEHVAQALGRERFAAAQMEWNLLQRHVESEVVPACRHYGVGVMPFYPIASGLLTGKYRRGEAFPSGSRLDANAYYASVATQRNLRAVERLGAFAQERGHSLLELAMSWVASQPGVSTVLVGATRPQQLEANAAAVGWVLCAEERAAIDQILAADREPGDLPFHERPVA